MRAFTILACLVACSSATLANKKRLIIDTDMLNFDDDPLAIGLANIFQNWGQVELISVISCINSRWVPPAADAINTYYGHPNIPLAVQKPVDNLTQWPDHPEFGDYLTGLTYNFKEDVRDGANTPDPVSSYRYLLSTSANNSITIAVIGFYNNMFQLMNSGPDQLSPLTGAELLVSKVREIVVQANDVGLSYNTGTFDPQYAAAFLNWWPGALTFASDEVGANTLLGARLTTERDPASNPLSFAFAANVGVGRTHPVWDAVAVYYAVCGLDDAFRWKYAHGGRATLDGEAFATWEDGSAETPGTQNSIQFVGSNETFAERLEGVLLWEPGHKVPRRSWCRNRLAV
ncbi:hypothetical protein F4819DRAFT_446240 [Hypoxylon fuscum]|nr:hypothetical protein F4819DRAFT_446240 [Hypoxylon fuscum]